MVPQGPPGLHGWAPLWAEPTHRVRETGVSDPFPVLHYSSQQPSQSD